MKPSHPPTLHLPASVGQPLGGPCTSPQPQEVHLVKKTKTLSAVVSLPRARWPSGSMWLQLCKDIGCPTSPWSSGSPSWLQTGITQDALQNTETWLVRAVCRAGAGFKVPQVILGLSLADGHLLNSPKLQNFFSCPETSLLLGHFVHLW